jgi:transposase
VHSRYTRRLRDVALASNPVVLHLQVRRFKCDNEECPRRIFSESIDEVTLPFQRSTKRSLAAQQRIALALGGEAGSRLAKSLGLPVSGDSLLRRLAKMESPTLGALRIIGVDDWAVRRGQTYGTLICDLERRCPVAMLQSRSAESLTAWLKDHPEIEVISRDRAGEYAKAATAGAPQAIQVADRWHLLRNATQALQKVVEPMQREINAAITAAALSSSEQSRTPENARAATTSLQQCTIDTSASPNGISAAKAAKYEAVNELSSKGYSQRAIARLAGLSRKTVQRYLASETYPLRNTPSRSSRINRYANQINGFLESGVDSAAEIYRQLADQGFTGSYYMVRRHLKKACRSVLSTGPNKKRLRVELWSSRRTAWLMSTPTDELSSLDATRVNAILQACPEVKIAADLISQFTKILRERTKHGFHSWICAATTPHIPKAIRNFALSLVKDQAAVEASLELPWSNGQLEGQINRLKMIKRQMYGRANLKLLECRVLNAA